MSNKGGNFFEKHVEKMVLAVVGLICLWLLVTHVLISPSAVKLGNRQLGPGDVDYWIRERAVQLADRLKDDPKPAPVRDPCYPRLDHLLASAVSIDEQLVTWLGPRNIPPNLDKREYNLPLVGRLTDVLVEHFRAVAYVPTVEIGADKAYEESTSEPNDIDFVTVEAKFDVGQLYRAFRESFAGQEVREEWRDPCLAKPVFAAVQLQRQERLADGSWSEWQGVPRARIDHRRDRFEIIEDVAHLPAGGVKVRRLQFDEPTVMIDLLQPEAYRIASADEEWFPPSIHIEYVKFRAEVEAQERRDAKEEEKKEREQRDRYGSRGGTGGLEMEFGPVGSGRYSERTARDRGRGQGGWRGGYEEERLPVRTAPADRRRKVSRSGKGPDASKPTSADDFYKALKEMLIDKRADISKMRKPLVLWAHDDTVQPGKTYRYRIRLGVFNPIADTNWFSEQDEALRNRVVLWSGFAQVGDPVEIPERLYFFPISVQEAVKKVTVQVSKYVLGRWRSKPFPVRQGEVIGRVVENHVAESESQTTSETEEKVMVPERIDYTTGKMLVDVVRVNDWEGGEGTIVRPRYYFDMLYSSDGIAIDHIPIDRLYWPKELLTVSRQIAKAEEKPEKPPRPWQSKLDQYMRRTPGSTVDEEYGEDEEMELEMEQYRKMMEMGRRGGH